jgi:hypothetical protein
VEVVFAVWFDFSDILVSRYYVQEKFVGPSYHNSFFCIVTQQMLGLCFEFCIEHSKINTVIVGHFYAMHDYTILILYMTFSQFKIYTYFYIF